MNGMARVVGVSESARATGQDHRGATLPAGAPARVPVHLTRRGRVVVTVLLVGLILALSVGVGAAVQARPDQAVPTVTTMTVRPGDTLWGIASRVSPGVDPRGMVLELRRLNPSSSGQLQAGQVLVVPTAAG